VKDHIEVAAESVQHAHMYIYTFVSIYICCQRC
jgi:hypothetical protein